MAYGHAIRRLVRTLSALGPGGIDDRHAGNIRSTPCIHKAFRSVAAGPRRFGGNCGIVDIHYYVRDVVYTIEEERGLPKVMVAMSSFPLVLRTFSVVYSVVSGVFLVQCLYVHELH